MKAIWKENKHSIIVLFASVIAFFVFQLIIKNQYLLEFYYSFIFRPLSFLSNKLFSFTIWSIGEIILYAFTGFVLFLLGWHVIRLIKTKRFVLKLFLHQVLTLLATLGFIYFVFMLFFGLNYYRTPYAEKQNYQTDSITLEETVIITRMLTHKANTLRSKLPEDTAGVMTLKYDYKHYLKHGLDGYHMLEPDSLVNAPKTASAKRLLITDVFAYMGVGGVFLPYTFEANVNMSLPEPFLPAIICHELAHLAGYATEDEANYISFLTSRANPNPEFQYSGYLMVLRYFLSQLNRMDRAAYEQIASNVHPGIVRDIQAHYRYWAQFKSPIEKVSQKIYNQYLKANNQSEGIMTYQEMVKLVIGEYRKNNNL